ncbi:MAG: hypothetical protein ACI4V7_01980 [Succinivibrionaceae bacterium]
MKDNLYNHYQESNESTLSFIENLRDFKSKCKPVSLFDIWSYLIAFIFLLMSVYFDYKLSSYFANVDEFVYRITGLHVSNDIIEIPVTVDDIKLFVIETPNRNGVNRDFYKKIKFSVSEEVLQNKNLKNIPHSFEKISDRISIDFPKGSNVFLAIDKNFLSGNNDFYITDGSYSFGDIFFMIGILTPLGPLLTLLLLLWFLKSTFLSFIRAYRFSRICPIYVYNTGIVNTKRIKFPLGDAVKEKYANIYKLALQNRIIEIPGCYGFNDDGSTRACICKMYFLKGIKPIYYCLDINKDLPFFKKMNKSENYGCFTKAKKIVDKINEHLEKAETLDLDYICNRIDEAILLFSIYNNVKATNYVTSLVLLKNTLTSYKINKANVDNILFYMVDKKIIPNIQRLADHMI